MTITSPTYSYRHISRARSQPVAIQLLADEDYQTGRMETMLSIEGSDNVEISSYYEFKPCRTDDR